MGGDLDFTLGSISEVGQKQRRKRKKRERPKVSDYNGQYLSPEPKQWPASLRLPPRVVHASTPGPT